MIEILTACISEMQRKKIGKRTNKKTGIVIIYLEYAA